MRRGADLLPQVGRRPTLLARCLMHARSAQIALVVFLAFAPFALPPLLDAVLPDLYPVIETQGKVLGIFPHWKSRADPRLEARRRQILFVSWASGISLVGALLLASLPAGVSHARRRAARLAEQANSCLSHNPAASALLYDSALALTLDPARAAELEQRLQRAEKQAQVSAPRGAPTTVVADSDLRALRGAETILDPGRPMRDPSSTSGDAGPAARYRLEKELGRGGMGVVYQAFAPGPRR